ncbi:hypothetical protein AJ80_04381 [Polytolypa hystricis UAMH7299]|uniref:AA9 family lytic polysaccharide monooxygenase n=1 Tax=Polytolypa hystricis (strain UAMH7299) TaxID=1447883 RepID=A0A2B7YCU4_POLH7|nr:hypothetical protein AJ80_04381 [Polytolypa hystricis UAMH7299]
MRSLLPVVSLLASATSVLGHATFQQLWVDGTDLQGLCVRPPQSNSPVESVSTTDIRCNRGGASGVSGVCEASPGQRIAVEMHQQPGDRRCDTEAIGGNHFGPVIIYLSKVSDATTADGSGSWFKVAEEGYSNNHWGTDSLNDDCGQFEFTLPNVAPGDYLLRAEAIALHVAGQQGGAQFYMSCYQLRIGGNGSLNPSGVSFPGAYSANDPGILINIYQDIGTYIIPGPPVVR